jgi:hypothetical protein
MVRSQRGQRVHPLLKTETALRIFIVRALQRLGLEPVQDIGRPARGFGVSFDSED